MLVPATCAAVGRANANDVGKVFCAGVEGDFGDILQLSERCLNSGKKGGVCG
jgi:hypothetical protein